MNKKYNNRNNQNNQNSIIILLIIVVIIIILYILSILSKYNIIIKQESFEDEPIDRTKLYGSLFLDNLNKQIKSLTNPSILYDTKRIELVRYNDVLL